MGAERLQAHDFKDGRPFHIVNIFTGLFLEVDKEHRGEIKVRVPDDLEQSRLDAAEVGLIESISIHSEMGSVKDRSFRAQLALDARSPLRPIAENPEEQVPESVFNSHPAMDRLPERIAAVKVSLDRNAGAWQTEVNPLGVLRLARAHDVVTSVGNLKEEIRQNKPEPTATRAQIAQMLKEQIERMAFTIEAEEKPVVLLRWYAADSMREKQTKTVVTVKDVAQVLIHVPDDAFLYCLYNGTTHVPAQYQEMADRFNQIIDVGIPGCLAGTEEHTLRLRGFSKEAGISNPHSVNAGFQGDNLLVEGILVLGVNGVHPSSTGFRQEMQKAVDLVRGLPFALEEQYRMLVDIIRRKQEGVVALELSPEGVEFLNVKTELNAYFEQEGIPARIEGDFFFFRKGEAQLDDATYRNFIFNTILANQLFDGMVH